MGGGEEERERVELADARSRDQVLHAGRAARHLHALSVSDRADADAHPDGVRIRKREPHDLHEQQRRKPRRYLDGLVARPVGRRHAGRRRQRVQRPDRGSIAPAIFTARRCTSSSAITPVSRDVLQYDVTIEDPKVFTRPWKMSMPLYRRVEKNAQLLEYKCVEFVEELMYGHLRKKTK